MYHSEVLGEKALTAYTFASNKLIRAKYMLSKVFSSRCTTAPLPFYTSESTNIGRMFS